MKLSDEKYLDYLEQKRNPTSNYYAQRDNSDSEFEPRNQGMSFAEYHFRGYDYGESKEEIEQEIKHKESLKFEPVSEEILERRRQLIQGRVIKKFGLDWVPGGKYWDSTDETFHYKYRNPQLPKSDFCAECNHIFKCGEWNILYHRRRLCKTCYAKETIQSNI